jgi:serine/threonine protein kinase
MGAVYQARDMKRQGAICAIKEMSLSMVAPEERDQAIQNFKIEAKILWGLNHPNLPAFTGFFSENQRYFLVMEYIDGMTLEELLERNKGPFSERRVLGWARQLCDVLEYLHSQNPPIIFRDMKPGNIMLTRSGHIKLIDFGIARFFRPSGKQDTQHLGTPGFAPPEQYGTAQTDERSDIYSLAMTLYQLLTDRFSEHTFGIENIRAVNPQVSPVVARALEKAADMRPEKRYKNVAEFRSALLGVGFVFDSGDLAMDPRELADLCVRYPEEAADYLIAGEIEAWLHEIGQEKLAREAQRIRTMIDDPQDAIESFIQITVGQHATTRGKSSARKSTNGSKNGVRKVIPADLANLRVTKPPQPVQVNPAALDFGSIFTRNISDAHTLTISGNEGMLVSGIVYSNDGWIMLDQTAFDGVTTHINVRINSSKLYSPAHYTGTIIIVPDPDNAQKDIIVPVEVDIIDPQVPNGALKPLRKAKTANADLDAYDADDDDFDAITLGGPIPQQQVQQIMRGMDDDEDKTIPMPPDKESEYRAKFGTPDAHGGTTDWELLHMSLRQRQILQHVMTFFAAFMLASLVYNLTGRALPPNPLCIIVLAGIIPAAAFGALVVNWKQAWPMRETLNRLCTGMVSTLPALALLNIIILRLPLLPQVYLVLMLLAAAASASVGITRTISDRIIDGIVWMLQNFNRRYSIIGMGVVGCLLGYFLTVGFALSPFTLVGIVLGAGVALALGGQVNSLLKTNQP